MMTPGHGDILGCILAGGLSRRMGGGDKTLIEIGGRPLLSHVLARLKPQVDAVILNANGDPKRFAHFGLPVVGDTMEGFPGPLAGVLAAMRHAENLRGAYTHVATVAADTPFFPEDFVTRLAQRASDESTVVLAKSDGRRHPVFGLWPVELADDLEKWLLATDTYKVLAWIGRHNMETVDFAMIASDGEERVDPFFNANTPGDIVAAEQALGAFVP